MVKLELHISATLENVTDLYKSEEDNWNFRTKCTKCNELSENVIYFNLV